MKVNVSDGGNSRLVNFLVTVDITNNLKAPKVLFDLDAEGDMTIENELQSMTPEQRSTQAMNLLLYGQYTGPNTRTQQGNFAENALYSFLTSTLNSWAANNIRGVDLSFGVNQYEQTVGGQDSQTTSYSYQVSKSLFDNRFKIVVGGNYTTESFGLDAADELTQAHLFFGGFYLLRDGDFRAEGDEHHVTAGEREVGGQSRTFGGDRLFGYLHQEFLSLLEDVGDGTLFGDVGFRGEF